MATKQEIIDRLSQCGGLSYQDWIRLLDSIYFDGDIGDVYLPTTSNVLPQNENSYTTFSIITEGTYTQSNGSPIVVPEGYLAIVSNSNGIWVNNRTVRITPEGTDTLQAELIPKGKAVTEYVKRDFYNKPLPYISATGFYNKDTGGFVNNAGYYSTPIYKVIPGMTFINPFQGVGLAAQAVYFNEDGTFHSSVTGQSGIVTIPNGVDSVGFSVNNAGAQVLVDSSFNSYNSIYSRLALKQVLKKNTDLAYLLDIATISSPNSIVGGFILSTGVIYNDANWWHTPLIPIREGSILVSGLFVSANNNIVLYDKDKIPVKRIPTTSSSISITIPSYVGYIKLANRTGNTLKITTSTDINLMSTVQDLPRSIKNITSNKTISLGANGRRFSVEFKSKVDLNKAVSTLNVISGGIVDFNIKTALTTNATNSQTITLNQSANIKLVNSNVSIDRNLGGEKIRLFEGKNLFWVRHTGTNYNLFWECKNNELKLYEDTTVLATYSFATYDTIGKLVLKIRSDVSSEIIPPFEVVVNEFSLTPTSKLATFEKIKASRTVTKSGVSVSTCFPTYLNEIDEAWHKLEIIFKDSNFNFCIDGMVYANNAYVNDIRLGGELIFDFTNFEFRNLEISDVLDYSFPIIRTVYAHGCIDGMGETTGVINTVDRTLEIDKAFKKRGFQSITYSQLMNYLKFGTPIPKRSYLITYDDSRNELYKELSVRRKLIENNIKTNNCAILRYADDEEIFIKSNAVELTNVLVGQRITLSYDSVLTYLGVSKFNSSYHCFKLSNPASFRPYSDAIIVDQVYTNGSSSVKFTTSPLNDVVSNNEVPYTEYSELIQEMPLILKDYGFDIHIHDYAHQDALDTMTYEEAYSNANNAINYFINRYGFKATGVVYPYGAVTIDHAKVWYNLGVSLGYTSTQTVQQLGLTHNAVPYMLDRDSLDSQTGNRVELYFTHSVYGLDNLLV